MTAANARLSSRLSSERTIADSMGSVMCVGRRVDAAALGAGQIVTQARQGEDLVSRGADHVLGLPRAVARDAGARVQRVQPAHAGQLGDGRHCGRCSPRGDAEQQTKARANRPELRLWPERQIDLQRVNEQEHAIQRVAVGYVEMVDRGVLAVHAVGPLADQHRAVSVSTDAQRQVDV